MSKALKKITEKMTIKEILEICPKAEKVFNEHFGFCATCPGAKMETLALGAHLHKKDVLQILEEINFLCSSNNKKINK